MLHHFKSLNMRKLVHTIVFLLAFFSFFGQTQVPVGPHTSQFASMVRGYHFIAPVNFTICQLYIPPDAVGAIGQLQHLRVVRFTAAAPPAFPGTTNAFVTLFSITGAAPTATVPCNIAIAAGDIIGVYGARAGNCINSYDGANFGTNISGFPTILRRSGMQACIAGGAPMANIWSEINFSIGRIFMYYNCCQTPTLTTAASATNVCSGTSVTILGGGATTYTWLPSNVNTSSIAATPSITTTYTLNGEQNGCIGTRTVAVVVNPTPTINSIGSNGPVCSGAALNLTVSNTSVGAPQGGLTTYSWTGPGGFSSNLQLPSIPASQGTNTGVYNLLVTNTFTNGAICTANSSTSALVVQTQSLSGSTYTVCQGAGLTLTTAAVGASSYSWSGPAAYTTSAQTATLANLLPANAGNYTATALFTHPQTTLVCSRTAVSNVSVVATSPVAINLVPNVCQNANATISASAAGAIGWSWTGPNNFTGNTATVTLNNIQPPSQGAYFATATFAIGTVSCTTQNSAVQNVVPVNPINVIPQISQCEPANISLQANSAGAATYSWTGPNSYTSNVSNPQMYGLLPNASGVYTVTTSYNNGNLICYNTNTTNVTINPKLNFTLTPYTLGCFNSLLNVNGPAGATSYTWTGSSGFTSNTQNLNIPFVQANQSGIYTLEVMLGPCKTSGSTRVDILDPLKFDKTPTNKTICRGEAVTFTMQSVGGSGNYAYVWNPPLYVGSPTGSVQSGNPLGTTIYNVTGYDIACPNYTINHTFTLTVNQPPQPNLNLEKVSGCQPLCLLYNSKTQSEASTTTYDFGNGIKFQADSIRYCIDVPGVYNLKIHSTGNNGCKGTYDYPLPITVYPKPGSSINHNPEYITLSDNQVVFNPSHQAGPIVSTNWIFLGTKESMNGQIDSSGIRNPERVFETAGKYPVMLVSTTDKGCVDSVVKFIEVNEDFSVYIPNTFTPNGDGVNDVFMVKGTGMKIENYTMEIFDRWGTMLYSSKDITKGWDGSAKGAQLPIGAYIYKVKVIGANGQGKKEYVGHVTLMK